MQKILTALLVFISYNIAAQDSIQVKELQEVVITGQYKPQSLKSSVYQVRVITREKIEKSGAERLDEVLSKELNFRFSNDLATGGSDITLNGLKGQNVKLLVDGVPVIGRQGVSNEIDLNQVDVHSIERIEIVEGPMSVIYGADALAGVINIITAKKSKSPFSVNAKLLEESIGKEYGIKQGIHNQRVGVNWRIKNWELGASAGRNYFGGWKDTSVGRELVWHRKDQLIGNGVIAFNNGKFNFRYRIDGLDEIITNPGNFIYRQQDSGDTLARDQEYLSQRVMQQLQAGYRINNDLSFQGQLAYTDYSRQVFSTTVSKTNGSVRMDLSPGSQSVVDFSGINFRATAVYRLSPLVAFQPGVDINSETGSGERLKEGVNKVSDFAGFITAEIIPSQTISIRPGLRMIHNSVYDAPPVIPSLNAKFKLSASADLRLAYAKGFRAPSLRELYFNFFDANHQIMGNPELKAETSNSFTGSVAWKKQYNQDLTLSGQLSGYYNDVKNLIDYAVSQNDPNLYQFVNLAESKTRGISMTGSVTRPRWDASVGAAFTGFYNEYSKTGDLETIQWSPELNMNFSYQFSKAGLDVNFFYKLTGKKPAYQVDGNQEIVLTRQKGYHLADIVLNKKFSRYFVLNAGVKNIFDVVRVKRTVSNSGIHTAAGTLNIGYGRSLFAGLAFNWEKKKNH